MPKESDPASEPGSGGRRSGRTGLSFFLVVVVAIVGLLGYLHTEDGFTRLLVPVLSRLLPSPVEAARGRASLLGHLEFDRARFRSPILGIDLAADRVVLDFDPVSLFVGRFHVYKGEVDGLRYRSTTAQGDEDEPEAKALAEEPEVATVTIPIEIDELRGRSVVWSSREGDGERAVIGPLEIEITDLRPGATGRFRLDGAAQVWPGRDGARAGRVQMQAQLTQDEEGMPTSGRLEASTQFGSSKGHGGGAVEMETILDLTFDDTNTRDAKLQLKAILDKKPAGAIDAATQWKVTGPRGVQHLRLVSGTMAVRSFQIAALNPLFDVLRMSRIEMGAVDGDLEIASDSAQSFELGLHIGLDNITAHIPDSDETTVPITLRLENESHWDDKQEELALETLFLHVESGGATRIEAVLAEPLIIQWAQGGGGEIEREDTAAMFNGKISDLRLSTLAPWCRAFGVDAFAPLTSGVLAGQIEVEVTKRGKDIRIGRRLRLSDLRFDVGATKVGPLTLSGELEARLRELKHLEVERLEANLSDSTGDLLAASGTGSLELSGPTGELHVEASTADLGRALSTLGALPSDVHGSVRGGATVASFEVGMNEAPPITALSGELTIGDLALVMNGGNVVRQDLHITTQLDAGADHGSLAIKELTAEIADSEKGHRARISAHGILDTSEAGVGGKLAVRVEGLRLGPWVDALGGAGFGVLGSLPLDAEIELLSEPQRGVLSLSGHEEIGFLVTGGGERKLTIHNEWKRTRGKSLDFEAQISGSGGAGADDRMTLEGEWLGAANGAREKLSIAANIERLDATPYLGPFLPEASPDEPRPQKAGPKGSAPQPVVVAEETGSAPVSVPERDEAGDPSGSSPMDLDLDVTLKQFRFREAEIGSGRVSARRSGRQLSVDIPQSQLLGGTMRADVVRNEGDRRQISWNVVVDKADVGKLTRSIGIEDRIEGILALDSSAKGAGANAEELRQNLAGHLTGKLSHARFAGTPLFTYMAEVTKIDQFEDIVFDNVQADIVIGEGLARIRHMQASGLVANVDFTGQATLAGQLDVRVNPRVGPSASGSLRKIFGVAFLLETASGFTALPMDVTVGGHYTDPQFGVRARLPGALDKLTGDMTDSAGDVMLDAGKRIGSGISDGLDGILKGGRSLFGDGD